MTKSRLEETLAVLLRHEGVAYEREYRFDDKRRWRFDFAFPDKRLAVEIDGGTWVRGRHQRPEGYERDCEKLNAAALAGWRVLRFTGKMVMNGTAMTTIKRSLADETA
jgi:very-short-patch-repair endonuclease